MATGPGFPGPLNVYVPSFEASGRLITGFSRNVKKFHLPKYVQYVPCTEMTGYFMRMSPQEAARVVSGQEFEWPDGQVRPMHADGLEQFNFVPFITHRFDYGFTVGQLTAKQATWDIVRQHSQIKAAQCMTARTVRMLTVATATTSWTVAASGDFDLSVDHTATAAAFAGGFLDQGTSAAPYIKIFLDKAAVLINQDTLGVVEQDALHVIINPNQARLWAECLSGETRFLTPYGPRTLGEMAGRSCQVVGAGGYWTGARIESFGKQRLSRIDLERDGERRSVFATDNHRWFVRADGLPDAEWRTGQIEPGMRLASVFLDRPSRPSHWAVEQVVPTDRLEEVYCARVPDGGAFLLDGDLLTGNSSEIHEYVKGSYWAKEEITQGLSPNNKYGLPSSLYGYPILVENCVKLTSRKSGPGTAGYTAPVKSFAMPDQVALVVARVGELEGVYGAPSFSALTIFHFGSEMEMETLDDVPNRLTSGHVTENTAEVVTSPLSGFLLSATTSKAS